MRDKIFRRFDRRYHTGITINSGYPYNEAMRIMASALVQEIKREQQTHQHLSTVEGNLSRQRFSFLSRYNFHAPYAIRQ